MGVVILDKYNNKYLVMDTENMQSALYTEAQIKNYGYVQDCMGIIYNNIGNQQFGARTIGTGVYVVLYGREHMIHITDGPFKYSYQLMCSDKTLALVRGTATIISSQVNLIHAFLFEGDAYVKVGITIARANGNNKYIEVLLKYDRRKNSWDTFNRSQFGRKQKVNTNRNYKVG